ncbi:hypothetical protein GCM10028808_74830 [Spirosoma migulaei]
MAADLNTLVPEFKVKVEQLLENCLKQGIEMRPNEALRGPLKQAIYWRQSRSIEEINKKIKELRVKEAPFLADCLEKVGPQHGKHVTDVIPGVSWHQWGEALDCLWIVKGEAEWSLTKLVNGLNGFKVYAQEAKKIGIEAGFFWPKFKDSPHVQLRKTANPSVILSLSDISKVMQERFSGAL